MLALASAGFGCTSLLGNGYGTEPSDAGTPLFEADATARDGNSTGETGETGAPDARRLRDAPAGDRDER